MEKSTLTSLKAGPKKLSSSVVSSRKHLYLCDSVFLTREAKRRVQMNGRVESHLLK